MKSATDALSDLTWAELESWAGFKNLSRGKACIRNVADLRMTSEGGLLAWVRDKFSTYATYIEPAKNGEPDWDCTCPYDWGGPCKHAVAVMLKAIDHLKEKEQFLKMAPNDERLALLFFSDDEGCDDMGRNAEVGKIVKAMKKDALVGLVLELAERFPQIEQDIIKRAGLPRRK